MVGWVSRRSLRNPPSIGGLRAEDDADPPYEAHRAAPNLRALGLNRPGGSPGAPSGLKKHSSGSPLTSPRIPRTTFPFRSMVPKTGPHSCARVRNLHRETHRTNVQRRRIEANRLNAQKSTSQHTQGKAASSKSRETRPYLAEAHPAPRREPGRIHHGLGTWLAHYGGDPAQAALAERLHRDVEAAAARSPGSEPSSPSRPATPPTCSTSNRSAAPRRSARNFSTTRSIAAATS